MPNLPTTNELLESIIKQIEAGVPPWRKPWSDPKQTVIIGSMRHVATSWPSNLRAPKSRYGILNGLILLTVASEHKYRTNLWITDSVIRDLDATVVGQATELQSYASDGSRTDQPRFVYNIDQVEDCEKTLGLSFSHRQESELDEIRYKRSEKLRKRLEDECYMKIIHGQPAYSPSRDEVMLLSRHQFNSEADYWATLWHEVVHWTAHPIRLNREQHKRWGDKVYAFEELIAELGAAFLCSHLDISGDLQHENYLASWCSALEKDNKEGKGIESLRKASEFATEANDYILGRTKTSTPRSSPF